MPAFDKAEVVTIQTADGKEYSRRNFNPNLCDERFITKDKPAWHQLGQVFTEPLTATEGTVRAGADFEVMVTPVVVEAYGETIETGGLAVVRQPLKEGDKPEFFGFSASKKFEVFQNREIARILDGIVEQHPLETVGVLGRGETTFWCFSLGVMDIKGDEVLSYLTVMERKEPGNALRWLVSPVRVECQNTLAIGIDAAVKNIAVRHSSGGKLDLDFYAQAEAAIASQQAAVAAAFRILAETRVSQAQAVDLIKQTYPEPKPSPKLQLWNSMGAAARLAVAPEARERIERAERVYQQSLERAREAQDSSLVLFERFNASQAPQLRGTAWGLYNSIAEYEDWYREMSVSGMNKSRAESIFIGDRADAVARGYKAAIEFARS